MIFICKHIPKLLVYIRILGRFPFVSLLLMFNLIELDLLIKYFGCKYISMVLLSPYIRIIYSNYHVTKTFDKLTYIDPQ